jgi:hypothetical protein
MKELLEFLSAPEVKERQEKDYTVLRFPFLEADKATSNNRVYPKSVLSKALQDVQSQVARGAVFGSSSHRTNLELDDVSHLIQKLEMEGALAICEAKILPTTKGKNLQVILKYGRLGVSARGVGSVKMEKDQEVVQPDYRILGVDFVTNPASGMMAGKENILESVGQAFIYPSQAFLSEEQILNEKFFLAQSAGFKGDFEQFKLFEENKDLLDLFSFATKSGYKGTFEDFTKLKRRS